MDTFVKPATVKEYLAAVAAVARQIPTLVRRLKVLRERRAWRKRLKVPCETTALRRSVASSKLLYDN